MEYASLVDDTPYAFQSTLVHELGHAFGLTHVDCFGYNPAHHSSGLSRSRDPGILNPEEYYILAVNRRAFPEFKFDPTLHNPRGKRIDPDRIRACYLGRMADSIGR